MHGNKVSLYFQSTSCPLFIIYPDSVFVLFNRKHNPTISPHQNICDDNDISHQDKQIDPLATFLQNYKTITPDLLAPLSPQAITSIQYFVPTMTKIPGNVYLGQNIQANPKARYVKVYPLLPLHSFPFYAHSPSLAALRDVKKYLFSIEKKLKEGGR